VIILIALLSLFIILFEVSFREITLLSNISLMVIVVNLLFWYKRYRTAFVVGILSSFIVDLFLERHLGETVFCLFIPLLIFTIFDGILRIESKLSRIIFSVVSSISSIFISQVLIQLVFLDSSIIINDFLKEVIASVVILIVTSLLFGRFLVLNEKKSKFK
jgi:hypothetical protein